MTAPAVRRASCAAAGCAVLVATVLPWSSTAAAHRNGWQTASLALALEQVVHRHLLVVLAGTWFLVPLVAAAVPLLAVLPARRAGARALRGAGVVLLLCAAAVAAGLHVAGWRIDPPGPLLTVLGAAALLVLARPPRSAPRGGATRTGVLR